MLVLSRKVNESIVISGNIIVTVVDIGGSKARLGVTAPNEVTINRLEVQQKIEDEKKGEQA